MTAQETERTEGIVDLFAGERTDCGRADMELCAGIARTVNRLLAQGLCVGRRHHGSNLSNKDVMKVSW